MIKCLINFNNLQVASSDKAPGPGSLPGRHPARTGAERRTRGDGGLDAGIGRRRDPQPGPIAEADALLEGTGENQERTGNSWKRASTTGLSRPCATGLTEWGRNARGKSPLLWHI
jgi:hypothetical protein